MNNLDKTSLGSQEFIRYYWASKYGYIPPKTLYKAMNEDLKENFKKKFGCNSVSAAWDKLLTEMKESSEILALLVTRELS